MSSNPVARISAQQLYSGVLGKKYQLTDEQVAAVEQASIVAPSLVVAGAGSGKTELMAVRVLWLVANEFAQPEQILGLTFTRKAASELSRRINNALRNLASHQEFCPQSLKGDFAPPWIGTYNSYANSLFHDFALGLGYEAESTLLTEAGSFQLARDVIQKYGMDVDPRLADQDADLKSTVEKVLALAQELNDNRQSSAAITELLDDYKENYAGIDPGPRGGNADSREIWDKFLVTDIIGKLADFYRAEKRRLSYVDYSDQVVLAERAVRELPAVRERENGRFKQVLLDEYQDTSFLQTQLLAGLFSGQSVFAVGDPNQSIYGWRGASAANLSSFGRDFADGFAEELGQAGGLAAEHFTLSVSWRNPTSVLELSNHLAAPLQLRPHYLPKQDWSLRPVELRPQTSAERGSIDVTWAQTLDEEAASVADWFKKHMGVGSAESGAVLLRAKTQMLTFVNALELRGLDVEVIGIGGLLEMPEVVDLVSALRVVHDPSSGSQLVRLLTGARWRIAAKDIDRLFRYAGKLNRKFSKQDGYAEEAALSLIDTLDALRDDYHAERSGIPEPGLARLRNAAEVFHNLRTKTGLPLVDFVRTVEQELWLDIEVRANPKRKQPMAHLNAFAESVSGYAAGAQKPTLGSFLRWLDFAEEYEKFDVPSPRPAVGRIQVQTVHSAKGLEWDLVAVPQLNAGTFPSTNKIGAGWLTPGVLPYPLRGDSESLPRWDLESNPPANHTEFKKTMDRFKELVREHKIAEELRLLYVAVTRPKQALLLSGSYWKGSNLTPSNRSPFMDSVLEVKHLVNIANLDVNGDLPATTSDTNPLLENEKTETWPLDPLGSTHGERVRRAAAQVRASIEAGDLRTIDLATAQTHLGDIDLLIAERAERLAQLDRVELPVRINASGFKDYLQDAENLADRMQRPVPLQPFAATRAGTIFHSLMEERFAGLADRWHTDSEGIDYETVAAGGAEISAAQLATMDLAAHQQRIETLLRTFDASRWAGLQPSDCEIEIQLAIGANIFICKLDAVFATPDGGFEIVDWKTGEPPKDAEEEYSRSLQLALYRMAYCELKGLPPAKVSATLYYVEANKELSPELLSKAQLLELWNQVAQPKAEA